jgi:hypothetical protein
VLRLAVLAATASVVALVLISPAPAASSCASRVLRDWSDDGHVASKYSLPCYEEAIEALPTDLRDYTNAEDVITRALTSAARAVGTESSAATPAGSARAIGSADRTPPRALVAAGSIAVLLLGAGAAGHALRRRQPADGEG